MRVLIDADGCPVVDIAIRAAKKHHTEVVLFCDTSHIFEREGALTVTLSQGADSADIALVNNIEPGDIVVTQDYGLAALALAKRALCMDQNGRAYTADNIDGLLMSRHQAKKIRKAGGRLKGGPKRTKEADISFLRAFEKWLPPADYK
jgi:uncharacterized protein YaiI (UPF0178 family)